ncbi:MAG: hypothetical protein Q9M97_01885 [Candidatus Gracilibacteria bacterium]|nr:hypothetical protein [Candidatus Gracilibacteria bacterium]
MVGRFSFEAMALELMKHIPLSKLGEHLQEDGERLNENSNILCH